MPSTQVPEVAFPPKRLKSTKIFVVLKFGEVGSGPPTKEGCGTFKVGVGEVFFVFGLGFFVGFVHDDEYAGYEFYAVWSSADVNQLFPTSRSFELGTCS